MALLRIISNTLRILAAAVILAAVPTAGTAAPITVTMASNVAVNNPGSVWVFAPEGFGFFAKEELVVKNIFNNGGSISFSQVAQGQATFGESSLENLINAIQAGVPLHPIAALITKSIYAVGVLENSPIRSYEQLAGKNIGVSSLTSGAYPFAQEAMADHNLIGKVKYTVAGNGGPAATALANSQVDALVTTDTQWATIANLGVKVRFLAPPAAAAYPSDLFFTSNEYYAAHKDVIVKWMAAVFAGIAQAEKHPDLALRYFEEQNPTLGNPANRSENAAILRARLANVKLIPEQGGQWGFMPLAAYTRVQYLGLQYDIIKKPGIDLNAALKNELVPAINAEVKRLLQSSR